MLLQTFSQQSCPEVISRRTPTREAVCRLQARASSDGDERTQNPNPKSRESRKVRAGHRKRLHIRFLPRCPVSTWQWREERGRRPSQYNCSRNSLQPACARALSPPPAQRPGQGTNLPQGRLQATCLAKAPLPRSVPFWCLLFHAELPPLSQGPPRVSASCDLLFLTCKSRIGPSLPFHFPSLAMHEGSGAKDSAPTFLFLICLYFFFFPLHP